MPKVFAKNLDKWRLDGYSFFMHDDAAMDQLLYRYWSEFPNLRQVQKCLTYGGAAKADLWRTLVLYEYGGIYTDIDNTPKKFNADTIAPEEDAFFQVESAGIPSQWFMAASPRHPIMFFAVERILINLLNLQDTGLLKIVWTTGPGAIKEAFNLFRRQTGDYLKAGLYVGTESRTVRLVGEQANEHEYVWRNSIKEKQEAYEAMDMKHLTRMGMTKGGETNLTCFEQLYRVEEKKNRLSPELNMW